MWVRISVVVLSLLFAFRSSGSDADRWVEQVKFRALMPEIPLVNLLGVTHGNSTWVAVGVVGAGAISSDGSAWTAVDTGVTVDLYDIAFGNGRFVAVGDSGITLTSSNGHDWEFHSGSPFDHLRRVTFGGGLFVASGDSGNIQISSDGAQWEVVANAPDTVHDLHYADGMFVAVGGSEAALSGFILSSTDGRNWRSSPDKITGTAMSVTHGNGQWLVSLQTGTYSYQHSPVLMRSSDGVNWSPRMELPLYTARGGRLVFGNGQFHLFSGWISHTAFIGYWVSSDGEDWTNNLYGIEHEEGYNTSYVYPVDVAFADGKGILLSTPDLDSFAPMIFQLEADGSASRQLDLHWTGGMGHDGEQFWYISRKSPETNLSLHYSPTGEHWHSAVVSTNEEISRAVAMGNRQFVLGTSNLFVSTNRMTWEIQPGGYPRGARYIAAGSNAVMLGYSTNVFCSTNGSNWTELTFPPDQTVTGIAWGGGRFVALTARTTSNYDYFGAAFVTDDYRTWSDSKESPGNWTKYLRTFKYAHGHFFFANYGLYHSTNGLDWSMLRTNTGLSNPSSIEFTGSHFLLFGGYHDGVQLGTMFAFDPESNELAGRSFSLPGIASTVFDGTRILASTYYGSALLSDPISNPNAPALAAEPRTLSIVLSGRTGLRYRIEQSAGLVGQNWQTVTNVILNGTNFSLPIPQMTNAIFYRAKLE